MNSQQIRNLLIIAECNSFSKAAEQLFLTHQALMRQITLIEKDVGFQIFNRSFRGVQPTEKGKRYIQGLKKLVAEHEILLQDCLATPDISCTLRLATIPQNPNFVNSIVLPVFIDENPDIKINFVTCSTQNFLSKLQTNEIDLFLSNHPRKKLSDDLCYLPLFSVQLYCLVLQSHHLAHFQTLDFSDLAGESVFCSDIYWYRHYKNHFKKNNITLQDTDLSYMSVCLRNDIFLSEVPYIPLPSHIKKIPLGKSFHSSVGYIYRTPPSSTIQKYLQIAQTCFSSI